MENLIWHPFTQEKTASQPIKIVKGQDAILYDENNKKYLDLISSWWVNMHGHSHPAIAEAIYQQACQLEHVIFAGHTHQPAETLVKKLNDILPSKLAKFFFSDNGSTAIEIAIKMALQFNYNQNLKKRHIICFEGGYHGDTFGAMSVGAGSDFFTPFKDFFFETQVIQYPKTWHNDYLVEQKEANAIKQLNEIIEKYSNEIAALIIEPLIQGSAGMRFARPQFIKQIAKIAQRHEILIIFDEVMTGFGRTGKMFAFMQTDVVPDFICLSKGLSGGFLPLSLTVTSEKIYNAFLDDEFAKAFAHGHSYTANPLGCAASIASLKVFEKENTLSKIAKIEKFHQDQIIKLKHPNIEKQRVMGSIMAFNLTGEQGYSSKIGQVLKQEFIKNGLLIRPLGNVIYLMPPYCITFEQLEETYSKIDKILYQVI